MGIAALIYVVLIGTFFSYKVRKDQRNLLRQQTITECLDARGHIGPLDTCRHDNPKWPVGIFPRVK